MLRWIALLILVAAAPLQALAQTDATAVENPAFGYELTPDVVFGTGAITVNGEVVQRDLRFDVYEPTDPTFGESRPAVVLVHGGAFNQGGRRRPPYREGGAVHSRMEDYARLLAPLGYVCFVIEYRLTPELPIPSNPLDSPGFQTAEEAVTPAALARTNFARGASGLPPLTLDEHSSEIMNGVMAAAEDADAAVRHIRNAASDYGVDPNRIAMGGHSAGGTTVLNAAFGLGTPLAAIFPLSPAPSGFDMREVVTGDGPPTLLLMSQYDAPVITEGMPDFIQILAAADVDYRFAWVPGFEHFYPTGAVSLANDGTRMSVGERVTEFLGETIGTR